VLSGLVVYLFVTRRRAGRDSLLSEKEIDALCAEWTPEPLVPSTPPSSMTVDEGIVVQGAVGRTVVVDGKSLVNFASYNFLDVIGNAEVRAACEATIVKYGVGACGPRGFYGTIDVHTDLEERLATFMGTKQSILYSYGFATIGSAIPAFAKRGDLLVCDEGINFACQTGVLLSRAHVRYYKHNDMGDLARVLQEIEDGPQPKKLNRRFIVFEGISQNYGDIAPLPEILKLKDRYKFRLMVEESMSIGVLGKTGRGLSEYYGEDIARLDLVTATLSNAFGSVGGFCVGSDTIVDHQRLSGAGYCFSAALPPYLATAASVIADRLMDKPDELLKPLNAAAKTLLDGAQQLAAKGICSVSGQSDSPIVHVRLPKPSGDRVADDTALRAIAKAVRNDGFCVVTSKYSAREKFPAEPSIRLVATAGQKADEIAGLFSSLEKHLSA